MGKKERKKKSIEKEISFINQKSEPILEILKRIIASGFIKNAKPLSCLLVAPVGAGKTTNLIKLSANKNIMALSDITPYGLTKLLPEIRAKGIKHIIIYDLVEPMSRSRSVVNNLIGFLNSLIEEGIFKIQTGYIEVKEPIKLGLITCTTKSELIDKRRGWLGIGFISRLLPISFDFTSYDVIQILEDLACQKVGDITYEKLKLAEKSIKENNMVFKKLIPYATEMSNPEEKPFRKLEQLKILLMSNALIEGRKEVTERDFEWFKSIVNYINYNLNHL